MSRKDNNFSFDSGEEPGDKSDSSDSTSGIDKDVSAARNDESGSSEESSQEEKREKSEKQEPAKKEAGDKKQEERPRYEYKPPEKDKEPETKKAGRSGRRSPHFVMFAGVFIIGILIGAVAMSTMGPYPATGAVVAGGEDIGAEAAEAKAVEFISERLEQTYPGIEVVSEGVTESTDIPGTYEVTITMTFQGQPQTVPYYVTSDGNWMFGGLIDLNEPLIEPTEQPTEPTDTGIPKSDKPVVDLFIMSYCPYGLQAQKAMLPVMELFGDKADITVKWVDYIMHGKKEIDENSVQYCIQKEEPEKYIQYAQCFTQSDDTEGCRAEAGIDESRLESCIAALDAEFKITELYNDQSTWSGGSYPQYPVDSAENDQFGVQGSPTLIINGVKASVARAPESYKQAICDAFNTPPAECEAELPTGQATPSFGGDFESGVGTAAAAQCG